MKELIINHLLNYEFLYFFLFCSIIFLLISMFVKKNLIKEILLAFFSISFVLFIFEFLISFEFKPVLLSFDFRYMSDYDINNIQKQRNLRFFLPNGEEYVTWNEKNIDKYKDATLVLDKTYSCYGNLFRFTECNNSSQENYIFLGDSFTFGLCLDDNETLPYYFSKKYNFDKNVINCGVCGHSTNTTLNILNNGVFLPLINKNSKTKKFFFGLIRDHIDRNFRYEKSLGQEDKDISDGYLYKNDKWYIPTTIGKIKYIFARSYIFRKFIPTIDDIFKNYYEDYMIRSLTEMNKIIEEKYNSKLTIIVWDKRKYSKYFMEKLSKTKLDLIILPEKFNSGDVYRFAFDRHPTPKANEEIAQILYNHINKINTFGKVNILGNINKFGKVNIFEKVNVNGKNNDSSKRRFLLRSKKSNKFSPGYSFKK